LSFALGGISLIITDQLSDEANRQETIAVSVAQSASQLSYLSSDYLIYHESQQLERCKSMYAFLSSENIQIEFESA